MLSKQPVVVSIDGFLCTHDFPKRYSEKQNQDIYNKEELFKLIGKTIVIRKFKDFAGEKYDIKTHTVTPAAGEREVYRVIVEDFCRICELYCNSTGDTKKRQGCV